MKIAIALLLFAGAAAGEERFGTRGTVAPSGSIGVSYASTPLSFGGIDSYGFSFSPGVMFFVADDIAIGGAVPFSYESSGGGGASDRINVTRYGIAPAVGWNLSLGERVSLFPQLTLITSWEKTAFSGSSFSRTDRVITAQAFVPVLLHVTSHFFIGLGPMISRDVDSTRQVLLLSSAGEAVVNDEVKTTTIGLQSVIGGWF